MMKLDGALKDLTEISPNRIQRFVERKTCWPLFAVMLVVCEFDALFLVSWAEAPASVTFPVNPFWSGSVSRCLELATS